MTSVSVTNTFVAGTTIESADANQNFSDLVGYINNEVIVRDASKAFTAIPTGPATDPTTANQLTRKQYVDNKISGLLGASFTTSNTVSTVVDALSATVATHTTDLTKRPRIYSQSTSAGTTAELPNAKMYTGSFVGTTDASGNISFVYGTPFTTLVTAVVSNGDESASEMVVELRSNSVSGWTAHCRWYQTVSPFGTPVLSVFANSAVRINYIAIGY